MKTAWFIVRGLFVAVLIHKLCEMGYIIAASVILSGFVIYTAIEEVRDAIRDLQAPAQRGEG